MHMIFLINRKRNASSKNITEGAFLNKEGSIEVKKKVHANSSFLNI